MEENLNLENKGQFKKRVMLVIAAITLVVLIGIIFLVGKATYPFKVLEHEKTIYLIKGETATTSFDIDNNAKKDLTFVTAFNQKEVKQEIPALSSAEMKVNLGKLNDDATFKTKYGFLGLNNLIVNVVVVAKSDVDLSDEKLEIINPKSKDANEYSPPQSEVTFHLTASNKADKPFKRSYDLKVNNKVVDTQEADWTINNSATTLAFTHTFKKEGIYQVDVAGTKLAYVISHIDKEPNKNTILIDKSSGEGILKLNNKNNHGIVFTLSLTDKPEIAQKKIYVKAKQEMTIYNVPNGSYYAYLQEGTNYSKVTKGYLSDQVNWRYKDIIEYKSNAYQYSGWTFEFGGNYQGPAATDRLGENEVLPN